MEKNLTMGELRKPCMIINYRYLEMKIKEFCWEKNDPILIVDSQSFEYLNYYFLKEPIYYLRSLVGIRMCP